MIVYFFLYESSELSLEGVDQVWGLALKYLTSCLLRHQMYNDPKCKPWTSRQWAPPGYKDRRDLVEQTRAAEGHKTIATMEHKENVTPSSSTHAAEKV